MKKELRCAIYTRKSTDDGLEQDFNSLDAQREACAAYIKSQAHEGWTLLNDTYDDGAYSGATLNRPAMAALLEKVKSGGVDVIVVYKVDRLTRSLMDFAKMVELFDKHGVSFVSVTQQFNTTSSIGRLTLNVLLSFAQFEREVTAERIRDKIAASRKKGLWMGGSVPIGYDIKDKRLIPNRQESASVRQIFELYLEIGAIRSLISELERRGIRPKPNKQKCGNGRFSRGQLHYLLRNPVYIGKARHKDKVYPGEHAAILSQDLFDKVQARLNAQAPFDTIKYRTKNPFLLRGLITDEDGNRLTTSHSNKKGKRYHYYISRQKDGEEPSKGWRLPAKELEALVVKAISGLLNNPQDLLELLELRDATPDDWSRLAAAAHMTQDDIRSDIARQCNTRIQIAHHQISLTFDIKALATALRLDTKKVMASEKTHVVPVHLRRRGIEAKMVLKGQPNTPDERDTRVIELIAKANQWFDLLRSGKEPSINAIAAKERVSASDVSRYLTLAFLDPQIVEAIVAGNPPIHLTANNLKRLTPIPSNWTDQAAHLGFGDPI